MIWHVALVFVGAGLLVVVVVVVVAGMGVQLGREVHVSDRPTAVQAEQMAVSVVVTVKVVTATVLVGSVV